MTAVKIIYGKMIDEKKEQKQILIMSQIIHLSQSDVEHWPQAKFQTI